MSKSAIILLAILGGPITGPLIYGFIRAVESRRWAMALIYAAGALEVWIAMGLIFTRLAGGVLLLAPVPSPLSDFP